MSESKRKCIAILAKMCQQTVRDMNDNISLDSMYDDGNDIFLITSLAVNWAACGSRDTVYTDKFIADLTRANELCKQANIAIKKLLKEDV